jgi:outer membrane receptor for ferrienterochelin and colicins
MRVRLAMLWTAFMLVPRSTSASPPEWLQPRDEVADDDTRVIVVSTGTKTERDAATTPVATEVVTREEIVGSGAQNVAEALEESGASIQTSTSFNGTSLRLRGLDPAQVLIVIDGQRVTGRIDGAIDLRRLTIENVERIEIVKGAGSVLYGSDAIGGVVNIVTRRPEPGVQAEGHLSYGSRTTLDASGRVAGGGRHWGLAAFGGYHRTADWDADSSDSSTTGDALQQWNVGGNARVDTRSRLRLNLGADYLSRDARGVSETAGGAVLDRRNLTGTSNATAQLEWLAPDSRLAVTLHHNHFHDQFRQDQRGDDALDQYQPTHDHIGQFGVQLDQIAGRHVVTTGLDAQLEWLTTARVIDERGGNEVERQRVALFVQDEWTPSQSPRVSLLPSLRVDVDSRFGTYPTGRLALLVQAPETVTLRVGYGHGYRAPSFREMYLAFTNAGVGYRVAGNTNLRPEQAWTLDLGATWTPREFLQLSAGVFDNRLRDLITTDRITLADADGLELFGYVNIGSAYTRGLEASASGEFLRHFTLTGSYTLLDARDQLTGARLPGRSTHQGTLSFEFHQRRWGTRLFMRAAAWSRRPYSDGDARVFAEPYASLDVRLSQSLLRYLTAFIGAENLLDAGDASLTPLPPRSFYGGLTVRY